MIPVLANGRTSLQNAPKDVSTILNHMNPVLASAPILTTLIPLQVVLGCARGFLTTRVIASNSNLIKLAFTGAMGVATLCDVLDFITAVHALKEQISIVNNENKNKAEEPYKEARRRLAVAVALLAGEVGVLFLDYGSIAMLVESMGLHSSETVTV
eukprot:Protomagalhaensia_sp_Gyna_25__1819@NODE_1961_length_1380_cov_1139_418345_g1615_i0_p2_GENE_NODE_1961_length_1380_cov_1139_418345_g1615_i0NODE_1961_length_1380_cov_1139_418345_g1615_i0_p2_ORF_typecomplete_len156_score5_43GHL15/PF14885_6/0_17_NODE_1961_length_1380_cov_1139_418345_g1615_i08711338